MPLNADQLDAFWAVVQSGGYHKAAEALFITQSAVTQRIQSLEATLGQRVFLRVGRSVALTDAGRVLVRYCQQQREAEARLLKTLGGAADSLAGRLAVACDSAEWRPWLVPVLAGIGNAHPELDLALVMDEGLDPAQRLRDCLVDLIVSERPLQGRGFRSGRVGTMAYALVIAPDAADLPETPDWPGLQRVRAIDFAARDRILLDHLALCLPQDDVSDLRCHYANDTGAILDWVLAGGGYASLPVHLVASWLGQGRLRRLFPGVTMPRPLYWSALDDARPPAVELLITRMAEGFPRFDKLACSDLPQAELD